MITRLYLDNAFKHHDRTFRFEGGMTAITGRNEAGKSLLAEMIRYALFGSAALRGSADDYKKLHVELDVFVDGVPYEIVRKGRKATIHRGGNPLASGTKEVNAAVLEILGYDLKVFDVANACNQGHVEALSEMRPTERRQMIDRTLGLDALDMVAVQIKDRLRDARAEARALEGMSAEPTAPPMVENYVPSPQLVPVVDQLRRDANEAAQLRGWLEARPAAPGEAPTTSVLMDAESLRILEVQRQEALTEKARLERQLERAEAPSMTLEEIAAVRAEWEKFYVWVDFRARNPKPTISLEEVGEMIEAWDIFEAHQRMDAVLAEVDQIQSDALVCPDCGVPVPQNPERLTALQAEFDQLDDAWGGFDRRQKPRLKRQELDHQRILNERWLTAPEMVSEPRVKVEELDRQADLHKLAEQAMAWRAELAAIRIPEDRSLELRERRRYEAELATWQAAQDAYDRYMADHEAKAARYEALKGAADALCEAETLLGAVRVYESYLATYERLLLQFREQQEKLAGLQARADQLEAVLTVLKDVKTEVKTLLIPSLAKVASHLLAQMTGGERAWIEITDDFEIYVDGQAVNTLSGSGKAVANLSLRLALGQVLTNRVFSVFLADEIDAAMDDERASYTAEALRRLSGTIKQIVLITHHKDPQVDHMIELSAAA